ncbi:MAG TPA: cysteine--tRNA ligase [Lentisphaeria bacterium]|nr:cysteine--tRNA ligase [Lentisphaerota bacterium]OQC12036.1 MAG: Cysteine--tRNA ligase [Lentisphaerae bacterium ADurb.Bin082]HPY89208.1 cysteine--tRNA ligase [Lentisphaeria bacterium]
MALTFYNSLTRRLQEFIPITPGQVGLYTCGPTVYNFAHIGNFRAYIFEDLLKRTLLYLGFQVKHIMNLTDVDDKTIRGAQAAGSSLNDFTQKYKDAFFQDIAALRILPADVYPAATEHIDDMIAIVEKLFAKGIAYQADDHSVYFSIAKWPSYGQLVNIDHSQMRSGARVKHDEYAKESIADFALWKAYDAADGDVAWDSPWGKGRPGWHLECSAMSSRYLGPTFDIHCGGIDNMFPHHEDEIAQSEAANGCRFVNYWLHCAHLMVDGQKMSKSLGNFFTLRDILAKGYTGREIRWVLLGAHYRQSLNFSFKALDDARAALQRLDTAKQRLAELVSAPNAGLQETATAVTTAESAFRAGLEDDLNISAALAALFDFIRDVNRLMDEQKLAGAAATKALSLLERMDTVLAVFTPDQDDEVPQAILALADERQAARKAKDFARADQIRHELDAQGWAIEDTPKGPRVKKKI